MRAKSLQSCPTLCDPIDGSPPGSPIPGILQARTLEWLAISFSNAGKWKVKVKLLSHFELLATQWTAAYQAPLSMGFSRQEYWSGVPLPSPLVLCNFHRKNTWKANTLCLILLFIPLNPDGLPLTFGFTETLCLTSCLTWTFPRLYFGIYISMV